MAELKRYIVVSHSDRNSFIKECNAAVDAGYTPVGGVLVYEPNKLSTELMQSFYLPDGAGPKLTATPAPEKAPTRSRGGMGAKKK